MPKILERAILAPQIVHLVVEDPELARVRKAGQFVIVRANADSERIPLSIAGGDPERGTIELVVQEVGLASHEICVKHPGEELADLMGPLGTPTHIENFGTAVAVGGGVGIAPLYPIVKALKEAGNHVIAVLGARSQDLLVFEDRMRAMCDETILCTDDGSAGHKGVVTEPLKGLIDSGRQIDYVITAGPPIMMKFVCETTRSAAIPTFASLNTMMIDGTGMCGGCRVTVGGETKYVCVDGPEFDGHQVDFDEMMRRLSMYREFETKAFSAHKENDPCRIGLGE